MTNMIPFPLFILLAALLSCLLVLLIIVVLTHALEVVRERFNGMELTILSLKIFPKEKVE